MLTNSDHQRTSTLLQRIISNLQVMARQSEWVLLQSTWPKTRLNLQLIQEPLLSIQIHNSSREQSARAQTILQAERFRVVQNHIAQFTTEHKERQALERVQLTVQPRI